MDEKKIASEREKFKKFDAVDSRIRDYKNSLDSVNRILEDKSLCSSDSIKIGYVTFYGEDAKRLALVIGCEIETMLAEASKEMDEYFLEKDKELRVE